MALLISIMPATVLKQDVICATTTPNLTLSSWHVARDTCNSRKSFEIAWIPQKVCCKVKAHCGMLWSKISRVGENLSSNNFEMFSIPLRAHLLRTSLCISHFIRKYLFVHVSVCIWKRLFFRWKRLYVWRAAQSMRSYLKLYDFIRFHQYCLWGISVDISYRII